MVRISTVEPLEGYTLLLTLTDGRTIERDVEHLLVGGLFSEIHDDSEVFRSVFAADGSVAWPNGADLCPDVLIWGGPPPVDDMSSSAAISAGP